VEDKGVVKKEVVCGGIEIEIPRVRYAIRSPKFSRFVVVLYALALIGSHDATPTPPALNGNNDERATNR